MKKALLSIMLLFICGALVFSGGGKQEAGKKDSGPIKIGNIQDLSGGASIAGQPNAWGAEYAVEQINAQGGINGRMIEITTLDCKNNLDEGINCYRKLVDEVGVCAIIGPPLSNPASGWVELSAEDKIPIVGHFMDEICTTNPVNGQVYPYMFLAEPSSAVQADCIAKFALETLKLKKFAVLYNTGNAFAVTQAKPFMDYVKAHGGQIVAEEHFSWTDTDYSAQALKIAAAKPDAVLLTDYAVQAASAYDFLRDAGYNGIILGANTLAPPLPSLVKNKIHDLYFLQNYDLNNKNAGRIYELTRLHTEKTKTEAVSTNVGFGWDAAQVLFAAMKKAQDPTNGEELREILENQTKDIPLAERTITLDPKTHRPTNMGMYIADYDDQNQARVLVYIQL
jgi:branched-chain amino acid transport system substrate-binding protein